MIRSLRTAVLAATLIATGAFATAAFAGARDGLNSFTTGLKGLNGQFTQQVFDANGKLKETSSG